MRLTRYVVPKHATDIAFSFVALETKRRFLDYPSTRWSPKIMQLLAYLPAQKGELCEPQIVFDWWNNPWKSDGKTMHVDKVPEWAEGRHYVNIIGVALTSASADNGAVIFKSSATGTVQPEMNIGDIVEFDGETEHVTGKFHPREGARIAVYFRFLNV